MRWAICALCAAACGSAEVGEDSEPVTVNQVAPIGGGNALTLPAQRHIVRIGDTTLAAVQQDGAGGRGLGFYRSGDGGQTWSYLAAIQNDWTERDTADLLVVGNDVALVYSFEGPTLAGSTRHDVYFQWWRARGGTWSPDPRVLLFDSVARTTAYYRAELARDSQGRIWVQAFKLEPGGAATARITVSTDGGRSFAVQPLLASLGYRGGGRLISLGTRLLFLYDGHEAGLEPARFRLRDDGDALNAWGPDQIAFSEGIYHGAALSAVADGQGGLELVYKDKALRLWHRHFDGATFGSRTLLDDSEGWEVQPAITRLGGDLAVFYNHAVVSASHDEIRYRLFEGGVMGAAQVLDSSDGFKGYPAAIDVLAGPEVPCLFGVTPDGDSSGNLRVYTVGSLGTFDDAFDRQIPPDGGLGASWSVVRGSWFATGHAVSDRDGGDLALETPVRCGDCRVEATLFTYRVPEAGVVLRASGDDRYEAVVTGDGLVVARRVRNGVVTVLGKAASGAGADPIRLTVTARGTAPAKLYVTVNGVQRLGVPDLSGLPAGQAGLTTTSAGVGFDDFVLAP